MRTLTNTQAYTRGAIALSTLAGWTPSRRTTLYSLLIATAASAAITAGAAIALPAAAHDAPGPVSHRMAELVEIYRAASAHLDAIAPLKNEAAWIAAESGWEAAEIALMNERPRTVCDFFIKFNALLEIDTSEGEFARLKRLSEDAADLGGCAK